MKAAVVGGGIAGLMASWFLSRAGYRVYIYEQNPNLPTASRISAGIIDLTLPPWILPLALESLSIYRSYFREAVRDAPIYWVSKLDSSCSDSTYRELSKLQLVKDEVGGPAKVDLGVDRSMAVGHGEVLRVIPSALVDTGDIYRAVLESERIELVEARVSAISCGEVYAGSSRSKFDLVVVSVGAWVAEIAGLEMLSGKFHIYSCDSISFKNGLVEAAVIDDSTGFYLAERPGEILAGDGCCKPVERPEDGFSPDIDTIVDVAMKVEKRIPHLSHSSVTAFRSSPCLTAKDAAPVVGPIPGCSSNYAILGLDGIGVTLAPALARMVTEAIEGRREIPRRLSSERQFNDVGGVLEPSSLC
ncbi:MAG: FAD-binding oxidoreductase [Aeropyrum sp.]|nr:FAD-binding oxidoreductase [Aeropyrum sp.]